MVGEEGMAGRPAARVERLLDVLEAGLERWAEAPVERAAEAEKVAKTARIFALGLRSLADAEGAVDKLRARAAADRRADEEDGEGDDDDEPRLSPEALEALRDDVERRYARFDQEPVGALAADPLDVRAGPPGGAGGVGGAGARAAAAAAGRVVDLAVPGRAGRGQDAGGRGVAHGPGS